MSQSYAYVNATIKKGDNAGKEVPYVSKHKFIFGADYEIVSDLHLFADYKFYSKKKDLNYDDISSRSIVDAGVSYKFKNGFGITGGVKNLFNKKYYDYQGKNSQTGIYEYSPANERNYYVEFKYTY